METLNKIFLIGWVYDTPKIKILQNGRKIAIFHLDIYEPNCIKSEHLKNRLYQHKIKVFQDSLVETVKCYIKKGTRLHVEGSLRVRKISDSTIKIDIIVQGSKTGLMILDSCKKNIIPPKKDPLEVYKSFQDSDNQI